MIIILDPLDSGLYAFAKTLGRIYKEEVSELKKDCFDALNEAVEKQKSLTNPPKFRITFVGHATPKHYGNEITPTQLVDYLTQYRCPLNDVKLDMIGCEVDLIASNTSYAKKVASRLYKLGYDTTVNACSSKITRNALAGMTVYLSNSTPEIAMMGVSQKDWAQYDQELAIEYANLKDAAQEHTETLQKQADLLQYEIIHVQTTLILSPEKWNTLLTKYDRHLEQLKKMAADRQVNIDEPIKTLTTHLTALTGHLKGDTLNNKAVQSVIQKANEQMKELSGKIQDANQTLFHKKLATVVSYLDKKYAEMIFDNHEVRRALDAYPTFQYAKHNFAAVNALSPTWHQLWVEIGNRIGELNLSDSPPITAIQKLQHLQTDIENHKTPFDSIINKIFDEKDLFTTNQLLEIKKLALRFCLPKKTSPTDRQAQTTFSQSTLRELLGSALNANMQSEITRLLLLGVDYTEIIATNDSKKIALLIKANRELKYQLPGDGLTITHRAIASDSDKTIPLLIKDGGHQALTAPDARGITPFMFAILENKEKMAETLLAHQKINISAELKRSTLPSPPGHKLAHLLVMQNRSVALLYKYGGKEALSTPNGSNVTPLALATLLGHTERVKELLDCNVNIDKSHANSPILTLIESERRNASAQHIAFCVKSFAAAKVNFAHAYYQNSALAVALKKHCFFSLLMMLIHTPPSQKTVLGLQAFKPQLLKKFFALLKETKEPERSQLFLNVLDQKNMLGRVLLAPSMTPNAKLFSTIQNCEQTLLSMARQLHINTISYPALLHK
jgi:ankyrin repeat protein